MNLDKSFIEGLKVDEDSLRRRVGERLGVKTDQVAAVTCLLAEGSTVPFIARYRKEKTGGLDEVQVRDIEHLFGAAMNLETRRLEIVRAVYGQGKLTEPLYENIISAASAAELEDIYAPYKRKKKTRGMLGLERGLGPLAAFMKEAEAEALLARAAEFVRPSAGETAEDGADLAVPTVQDALQGAMDIIAEETSQDTKNRAAVKAFYYRDGRIIVKARQDRAEGEKGGEDAKKAATYQMYWDYAEPLSRIKAHRILAINRGEREGFLDVTVDVDENAAVHLLQENYALHNDYHRTAIEDGLKRLLSPAVIREIRGDQNEAADDHGISDFAENLKNLLMQQPIKGTRVLGIDPGIRTGTKCALLDDTGKYLGSFVIYQHRPEEAKKLLLEGIKRYDIQLAAVGNGTGSREVQELVSQLITENSLELLYTVVDEDGASVYSASDIAREEFPDLDLTIRGAVSIGRRLQDPLAELVKIDPKSIGVGLYQHDLNQRKLSETLDEVVSSVVNNVGVNLNTASVSLLKYVSGINGALARKIVSYRNEKGRIESREELVTVNGMGPKSYEQCAGFLKIPESAEPLDNTWVHPENYGVAREIRAIMGSSTVTAGLSSVTITELKEKYGVGDVTISDIAEELKKPNRDPRSDYPQPVTRKGLVKFEDLVEGMTVTGKIKNVVDFGAFVDLGIKETALVHISELANHFVKNPLDAVKVGDVLEFKIISRDVERRRIGLSRKVLSGAETARGGTPAAPRRKDGVPAESGGAEPRAAGATRRARAAGSGQRTAGSAQPHTRPQAQQHAQPGGAAGLPANPRPAARPPAGTRDAQRPAQRAAPRPAADDDGTMYNPFAEALKNRLAPTAGPGRNAQGNNAAGQNARGGVKK
ncbi:MAG: helix-hairpin-helix domain-containing protein [Treponema sp.]|jgi:uncharacterized protein|nr:helix-hairpin-helix domain-containing protein [Treponema sp.]